MKLWWVTIKAPKAMGDRKHRVHRYVVMAGDADAAKLLALEDYGPRGANAVRVNAEEWEGSVAQHGIVLED